MKEFLSQIANVNKSGYYYVALMSALTIPDICGALESQDGTATKHRYISWYDRNVPKSLAPGKLVYQFRCSMLHQGRARVDNKPISRIIFIEPGATTNKVYDCSMGDAYVIDVQIFITDLINSALIWLTEAEKTINYQKNRSLFVSRHPDGLTPYIGGVPVIG